MTHFLRKFRMLLLVASGAALALLVWKIAVSDRIPYIAWASYAPTLLLAPGVLLFPFLVPGNWGARRRGALLIILAGALTWTQFLEQPALFRLSATPETLDGQPLRVMAFNVMAYHQSETAVVDAITEIDPDVLILVEGAWRGRKPDGLARRMGRDYVWGTHARLAIASRHPIEKTRDLTIGKAAHAIEATIDVDGRAVRIVAIDMPPPGRREDHSSAEALAQLMQDQLTLGGDVIVGGDFNLPRGSFLLANATDGWSDAFLTVCDDRWLASWHTQLPAWQIDHLLHSGATPEALTAVRARFGSSEASDHRPVIVDYVLR